MGKLDGKLAVVTGGNPGPLKAGECIIANSFTEFGSGTESRLAASLPFRKQVSTPAYCPDPTIQQLSTLLQRAESEKGPRNRDQAAKIMAKLPPDFSSQEPVRVARLSAG